MQRGVLPDIGVVLAIWLATLAVTAGKLDNQFVYDDIGVIVPVTLVSSRPT